MATRAAFNGYEACSLRCRAETTAPLRRNVTTEEVGNAAAFLCSDLASGITGEILYVDAGFSTTAFGAFD